MPHILVDLSSDGKYHVEVSKEELALLTLLNKQYGSIHDALNKTDESTPEHQICIDIMNREKSRIPQFIFYM